MKISNRRRPATLLRLLSLAALPIGLMLGAGQAAAACSGNSGNKADITQASNNSAVEGSTITLDVHNSSKGSTFAWTHVSGPAVTLTPSSGLSTSFVVPSLGSATGAQIRVRLTASGCNGSPSSDTEDFVLNVTKLANIAPVAVATASPASVNEGGAVSLLSTGSYDPDGDAINFTWTQVSGPAVVLGTPNTATATFTAPLVSATTTLQFRLTVAESLPSPKSTSALVNVNVVHVNQPPQATLSCPAEVDEGDTITLDGSASSDPDGDTLTYSFSQVTGLPLAMLPAPPFGNSISFAAPSLGLGQTGHVEFGLVVTDPENASSNVASCNLFINDVTAPVLSGGGDQTLEATSPAGAVASFEVTANDNVDGASIATCEPESGSDFPLGPTLVTCGQSDSASPPNFASKSFTITVVDTTAPVIAAHDDVTAEATGPDGAIVNYTAPTTSDAYDGAGSASCAPASGSQFALGETLVECDATDSQGNAAATTSFTVLVQDTVAPVITAPANVSVEATGLLTTVAYDQATATDAVGPVTITSDAPAQFPVGTTTITWTAKDGAMNSASTTSTVTVIDSTPPTVDDNADQTVEAAGPLGAEVSFDPPMAHDLVDGDFASTCDHASGVFALGTTTVTCSATDTAGNTGSSSFTVTVEDTTPPVIDAHGDETAEATSPAGAFVSYIAPATSDLVDGAGSASCLPASGSQFALGATTVNCSASDAAGNVAAATRFTVNVVDTTDPVLTLPASFSLEATGPSGAVASFVASASDIADANVVAICSPASGSTFALGATAVLCSATDDSGNTANGSFTVTVVDTTPPVIAFHADVTALATSASGAVVSYTLPSATDLVDGTVTVTCSPVSGSTFAVGTTAVNCSATDAAGNTSTSSFNVIVSYNFTGFFRPIDNLPVVNVVKAGQAIPVKFSLGGNMGLAIFSAGYPRSVAMTCGGAAPQDAVEETVTAGGSSLSYDASTGQYIYVWKTEKSWSGSCRQLQVKLADGSLRLANFNFTR